MRRSQEQWRLRCGLNTLSPEKLGFLFHIKPTFTELLLHPNKLCFFCLNLTEAWKHHLCMSHSRFWMRCWGDRSPEGSLGFHLITNTERTVHPKSWYFVLQLAVLRLSCSTSYFPWSWNKLKLISEIRMWAVMKINKLLSFQIGQNVVHYVTERSQTNNNHNQPIPKVSVCFWALKKVLNPGVNPLDADCIVSMMKLKQLNMGTWPYIFNFHQH